MCALDKWTVGFYVELEKLWRVGVAFGIDSSSAVGYSVGEVD